MGKIINGVPNWAVYAGGAFAVYWFFFREDATWVPSQSRVRVRTERERYLAAREAGIGSAAGGTRLRYVAVAE